MTKEVFLALLTEEGLTVWEAGTFWEAQVKHFPETMEHLTATDVLALGREVFPD